MDQPNSLHSPRAVVIEDDPEIRALHQQVLEPLGFKVILTANASDGISAVREFSPEITFLDVSMDGMDGFAAATRIRSFSSTYIIMITALDSEIDVVQGLNAGADDYVLKPFRPRELRARVEAVMRRPRIPTAASAPAPEATIAVPQITPPPAHVPEPKPEPVVLVTEIVPDPEPALETNLWGSSAEVPMVAPTPAETALAFASAPSAVFSTPPSQVTPSHVPPSHVPPKVGLQSQPIAKDSGFDDLEIWRSHRDLHLNVRTGVVRAFDQQIQLEQAEAALLSALMDSGARVRSTANLVLSLRGESYVTTYFVNESDKRSVLDSMESLRRKLGDTGSSPIWIEPVRGVGYRMTSA